MYALSQLYIANLAAAMAVVKQWERQIPAVRRTRFSAESEQARATRAERSWGRPENLNKHITALNLSRIAGSSICDRPTSPIPLSPAINYTPRLTATGAGRLSRATRAIIVNQAHRRCYRVPGHSCADFCTSLHRTGVHARSRARMKKRERERKQGRKRASGGEGGRRVSVM